jgi:DNA replication protein DnaC
LNKMLVLELARGEYVERRENVIALGPSGTGKTHIALGLGLAACQKGLAVGFTTAAALVHELWSQGRASPPAPAARLAGYKLLIVDELGYVPLSPSGAELCSRSSAGATSAARSWSPATCRSTSGRPCSARSG